LFQQLKRANFYSNKKLLLIGGLQEGQSHPSIR